MRIAAQLAVVVTATLAILPARGALVNGINGIVHDTVITYQDVDEITAPARQYLAREFRGQDEVIQKKLAQARQENLDQLVERQLIVQDFKTAGYNLPETTLDDLVEDEIRTRYKDRRTLTKDLQARGLTYEKYRNKLREQYIVSAMRNKKISSEIIVSPHRMERYYEAHREAYKVEEEVKLRMIELHRSPEPGSPPPRKLAEEILRKLNEGVPFDEMATIHTQRPQQKKEAEWFGKSVLRTELADVALKLKPGERSGIVEAGDSCYILQVQEMRPERFLPLSEVRDVIEKSLVAEERARIEKQYVERLKKKTFVRYY